MSRKKLLFFVLPLLLIALIPTGCFNSLFLTDSQLDAYYSNKPSKPVYRTLDETNDRHVFYAETGSDTLPLVLFIHGAPGVWHYYKQYLSDSMLLKHAHMIAVDRPGYGKSDYGRSLTSIKEQARMLHDIIMARKNGRPVIVVGRSYGGPVAARIAMDYPHDVDALVLLAPALDPAHEKFWWFSKPAKCAPVCWFLPKSVNVASAEKFSHVKELKEMLPLWDSICAQATVVQGSADDIVDTANFSFAKRKLHDPHDRFIWLPGMDHYIADRRPDLVKQIIVQYTDSLYRKN